MAEPFLSEIRIFSFGFAPQGWALCNGQLLPINQNQALFSLLGTTYGGNGQTNFALPDVRGRVPMHVGSGMTLGERAGEQAHTLSISEMPSHTHQALASANGPTVTAPTGNFWASNTGFTPYGTAANTAMSLQSLSNTGGSQAHENRSPFLTLNYCIALQGIFPSPN
ncbi:MAG: tail fiber protein [Ferruginibacter sp.]